MGGIYTIGYEGATPDSFVDILIQNKIDVLLDVRELPISRKKGFSKNSLKDLMESSGIRYHHEKSLGSPKDVRKRLYDSKDYQAFFQEYEQHLAGCKELLSALTKQLDGNVALMCFERDVMTCHRKCVARKMSQMTGNKVHHLKV